MCCETPPFGHLGVSQRTKWGMINGLTGHQSKVQRRSFGGSRAEKWGAESSLNAQNLCKKRKKTIHFAIFRARKTASFIGIKHGGKTHSTLCFTITVNTDFQHIALHLTPIPTMTSPPLQQIHYAMGKNLHLQLHSVFSFQFSVSFFAMSTTPKNWYTDFIIYIYYNYIFNRNEGILM